MDDKSRRVLNKVSLVSLVLVVLMVLVVLAYNKKDKSVEVKNNTEVTSVESSLESDTSVENTVESDTSVENTVDTDIENSVENLVESNEEIDSAESGIEALGVLDRALRYLSIITNNEVTTNTVYSPASLEIALSMAANGMTDEAKEEFERFMSSDIENLNEVYGDLISKADEINNKNMHSSQYNNQTLHIANSFLVKEGSLIDGNVNQEFKNTVESIYNAQVDKFTNSDKVKINQWVSDHTGGKIRELVNQEQVEGSDSMLINTAYFSDSWADEFDEYNTIKHEFKTPTGVVDCDMMFKYEDSSVGYLNHNGVEGVALNYGGDYRFIAFKPNGGLENINITDLIESMTHEYDVTLGLPKFEAKSNLELIPILETMGLNKIFSQTAMNNILDNALVDMNISNIIQKATIELDEKGTVATAATVVTMKLNSAFMEETNIKEVIFDEPFVYMIVNKSNDLVLFVGTVSDPTI